MDTIVILFIASLPIFLWTTRRTASHENSLRMLRDQIDDLQFKFNRLENRPPAMMAQLEHGYREMTKVPMITLHTARLNDEQLQLLNSIDQLLSTMTRGDVDRMRIRIQEMVAIIERENDVR